MKHLEPSRCCSFSRLYFFVSSPSLSLHRIKTQSAKRKASAHHDSSLFFPFSDTARAICRRLYGHRHNNPMDYATEKKVRPLYEAIDEGQNKLALQHCAKLLKKSPDWPLIKALKALVLVRTGKEDEALELCQQVKAVVPTDDPTLQASTMALKELGKHSLVVELYENAANLQPKNEEFANHWFMAMVRNSDYKGQQTAAVKLHRLFKQNKYLFWAIMSLALQGSSNKLAYTLAERMMAKAMEEGRLDQVEHMRLYLLILMDQQKIKEALALLDTTREEESKDSKRLRLAEKASKDPEVRQIKSELLRGNQHWDAVMDMSREVLEKENSDDWFHWLAYFDAVDAVVKDDESVVAKTEAFIEAIQKTMLDKKSPLQRGPFLAELEFNHRLFKLGKKDKKVVLDVIVSYFVKFGSKSCAFEDLQTYVDFLKDQREEATALISRLKETIQSSNEKAAMIKNVYKNVNIRKLEHVLNLHTVSDVQHSLEIVNDLWHEYLKALPLGEHLEKTEMQFGDEFVVLASHILLELYDHQHRKDTSYLVQAITFLETALVKSIHNFQIKLILVRIYLMMGAFTRAFEIYRTMEIKQIQYDTMIHYFSDRFISLGCVDNLESILYESLSIYRSNEVETPEMLVKAYQFGTFSKIQEFIEFRRRLDTSLQHAITNIETTRIGFAHSSFQTKYAVQYFQEHSISDIGYTDSFISERSDNRDFKVFSNFNNADKQSAEIMCKPAASSNPLWVQIFGYILSIMSAVCDTKEPFKNLENLVVELKQTLAKDTVHSCVTEEEFTMASYIAELADALNAISNKKDNNAAVVNLQQAIKFLQEPVLNVTAINAAACCWNTFHGVSIALESFNYGAVLIEMINRALGMNSKDSRKKAVEKAANDPFMACFVALQDTVRNSLLNLQKVLREGKELFKTQLPKKMQKTLLNPENSTVASSLKTNKDCQDRLAEVLKNLTHSWGLSTAHFADEVDRRVQKL